MKKLYSLAAGIALATCLHAQFQNAGFEAWNGDSLSGWTLAAHSTQSSEARTGSHALRVSLDDADPLSELTFTGTPAHKLAPISSPPAQTPTRVYGWYKGNLRNGDKARVYVNFAKNGGKYAAGVSFVDFTTAVYRQFYVPVTVGFNQQPDEVGIEIDLEDGSGLDSGTYVIFDDFSFSQNPTGIAEETAEYLRYIYSDASGATHIVYELSEPALVDMSICSTNGQLLKTVLSEQQAAGRYKMVIDDLPNGVYLCTIKAGARTGTAKFVVNR